ncbi:dienelactone hydrolase family protein [Gymnodinialimonas sp. 57CJ19]|uniref:alpha/beta hydrolase n=1 Tax=Gymnodinialimonas sp. 57CJ19 TaxID=3138498 RepID=UPI0031342CEF
MSTGIGLETGGHGPHAGQRLVTTGAPLSRASAVAVMLHGRGGQPADMVGLAEHLGLPDLAVVATTAAGHSWWPDSFLAPLDANEPGLGSGLSVVEAVLDSLSAEGVTAGQIVLMGFSQGACLALEAAARLARPFRAVAALSGGLVGTQDTAEPGSEALYGHRPKQFDYAGRLDGVPVLIGCHERDPHIPLARVQQSERKLQEMGANVETMIIPGAGHGIIEQEATWLRKHLNTGP